MCKKSIYPKTQRMTSESETIVTEKLDGSNLSLFKLGEMLYIAQRNNVYSFEEIDEVKGIMYQGLYDWLKKHGDSLNQSLRENSAIIGEWIGMGNIKYGMTFEGKKFMMFAKANVNDKHVLYNLRYNPELFIYPFEELEIPNFIGIVPVVLKGKEVSIEDLNKIYDEYTSQVDRKVEGFIVSNGSVVRKYVRFKSGKLTDHKD